MLDYGFYASSATPTPLSHMDAYVAIDVVPSPRPSAQAAFALSVRAGMLVSAANMRLKLGMVKMAVSSIARANQR